ncbi:MAG: hypothetical protein JO340_04785 [Acidobacteriaceae bacterium]|nr:hypothetical protein [Acidobacteriaceae bacterium]
MRRTCHLTLIILVTLGSCYAQTQDSLAEISLTSSDAFPVVGSPIFISIKLTNLSTAPIRIIETNPNKEYRLSVLDESGAQVPLTPYGKEMGDEQGVIERNFARTLQPKEASALRLDLNRFFEFRHPGKYRVFAKRKVYKSNPNSGVDITSNDLAIDLVN